MPATSSAQMHTAQMARAVKAGTLAMHEVPMGARKAVKAMMGMSDTQLRDYTHTARKGKG